MLFDGRRQPLPGPYSAATQTDNLDAHDGYNPVKGHIGVAVVPAFLHWLSSPADRWGRGARSDHPRIRDSWAGRACARYRQRLPYLRGVERPWRCGSRSAGPRAVAGAVPRGHRHRRTSWPRRHDARDRQPEHAYDGSGWGAMVGISAAILAEQGFTGALAITVEADEVADIWSDLGTRWIMTDQYVKPYPICRWAHAPIDGVRELMMANNLTHDDIGEIRINTFHEGVCLSGVFPRRRQRRNIRCLAVAVQAVHGGSV